MRSMKTEILIAGAGPAGWAASMHLSKNKIPHLLIDKNEFPRDKICGDALSGKVVQELNRLDPRWIQEMESSGTMFTGSYGVQFHAPDGNAIDIPFRKDKSTLKNAPGYLCPRLQFDNYLLSKIDPRYATFLSSTALEHARYHEGGLELSVSNHMEQFTIHADILIAADGDRSLVKKIFSTHKKNDTHYCAGIRAYYSGVKNLHPENYIELHFLKSVLPGYIWVFPLPNGQANVGIGMLSAVVKQKKINLRKLLDDTLKTTAPFKERFSGARQTDEYRGWGLPLGSARQSLSQSNILFTGDAGSLIDPFTGEGIGNAMVSGRLAAQTATEAVQNERTDAEFLNRYDQQVYQSLSKELQLSHTLQRLSTKAWLFNWVVRKAKRNESVRDLITCMFEDLDIREKLKKPGFYFNLLFR